MCRATPERAVPGVVRKALAERGADASRDRLLPSSIISYGSTLVDLMR
jgi:hypothetical protein